MAKYQVTIWMPSGLLGRMQTSKAEDCREGSVGKALVTPGKQATLSASLSCPCKLVSVWAVEIRDPWGNLANYAE